MSKYTSEQYNKVFWKLPVEIRDIITSYSTTEHINIIGQKHNLHIDKIGELVDVTFDVIMGIVATKDFVKELQDTLQINALEAAVLARDIDENIFKPIKDTMIHLYAGRAPYKPSSSLVQYYEEDDEHPALDQATLLKEIEDPEPSQVKKETVVTVGKGVSVQAGKEIPSNLTTSDTNTLAEYHQEIEKQPTDKGVNVQASEARPNTTPNNLAPSHTDTQVASSILNQIASLKLNQAFVMPKGAEGIQELRKLEGDTGGKLLAVSLEGKEQTSGLAGKMDELKNMEEARLKKENQIITPRSSTTTPLILSGEGMPKAIPNNLTPSDTNTLPPKIDPYRERI